MEDLKHEIKQLNNLIEALNKELLSRQEEAKYLNEKNRRLAKIIASRQEQEETVIRITRGYRLHDSKDQVDSILIVFGD